MNNSFKHGNPVASLCHRPYNFFTFFAKTDHTIPAHGVSATPSSTYCPYTRTCCHEDVPSSRKKRPSARRMLSTTDQPTIRERRYSVQPPLNALRNFQARHIEFNKICICVKANLPSDKGLTPFKERLMGEFQHLHVLNASSYSRTSLLNALRRLKLYTERRLRSPICIKAQVSKFQKR